MAGPANLRIPPTVLRRRRVTPSRVRSRAQSRAREFTRYRGISSATAGCPRLAACRGRIKKATDQAVQWATNQEGDDSSYVSPWAPCSSGSHDPQGSLPQPTRGAKRYVLFWHSTFRTTNIGSIRRKYSYFKKYEGRSDRMATDDDRQGRDRMDWLGWNAESPELL